MLGASNRLSLWVSSIAVTNNSHAWVVGQYSLQLLRSELGAIGNRYLTRVNTATHANTATVVRMLQEAPDRPEEVVVEGQHEDYAILALQGPRVDEVMEAVGLKLARVFCRAVARELSRMRC